MRALLLLILSPLAVLAQGTKADYERSQNLYARFGGKVFRDRIEPTWSEDGQQLWYTVPLADGKKEFVLVAVAKGTREVVSEDKLPKGGIKSKEPKKKGRTEDEPLVPSSEGEPELPAELVVQARPRDGTASPDGKWQAFVKDFNVWLRDVGTKEERKLTDGGSAETPFERFTWSPDSRHFIIRQMQKTTGRVVTMIDSSPKDQLQPKVVTMQYDKPGDDLPQPKLFLGDVAKKTCVVVKADKLNPWQISDEMWTADSKQFLFLYVERGHERVTLFQVSPQTSIAEPLMDEQPKMFFDTAHKKFLRMLEPTNEFIWMSERDGWNHLYLMELTTGKVKQQITKGEWLVRRVLNVDAEKRELLLEILGFHPKQDPYHSHYARVTFDGKITPLTDADGTHTVPRFSPDRKHYLVSYSRVDLPPVTELRRTSDGKLVLQLEKADITALEKAGWKAPERFVSPARDGQTDIHGILHRPTHFDPKKTYPVIEYIYAGPHGFHVPKAFRAVHFPMPMAELGFIVVQIDGMGTNWRSKAFHNYCWKNLGDSGFPDRIPWIKAAASQYKEMDLSRGVGIYGGSAGGQSSTRAVFAHPQFYTVAVSDCGCHDNRMDKVWWNEQWMGFPIGKHYAEQSNSNPAMVKQFKGKLMLTVGELDKNVDPASTMQVANALIQANKDFDLIVFPGAGHGACESPYGQRRRADFFVRHLLGVEPRAK